MSDSLDEFRRLLRALCDADQASPDFVYAILDEADVLWRVLSAAERQIVNDEITAIVAAGEKEGVK